MPDDPEYSLNDYPDNAPAPDPAPDPDPDNAPEPDPAPAPGPGPTGGQIYTLDINDWVCGEEISLSNFTDGNLFLSTS